MSIKFAEAVPAGLDSPNHFRPEIQGLRAIAVLVVLLFHLWPGALSGGYVGVDVFFVISGFLITGLLLRQAEIHGGILIVDFYIKRIKRLLPAATVVLVAVGTCVSLLPIVRWTDTANEIAASALYFQNWWLAAQAVDYLAADNPPSPLQHFWSLSVEEQYYIAWPILFAISGWCLRRRLSARQIFAGIILAVGTSSLLYSIFLTPRDPGVAYFATTTRAWELALGGALAVFAGWERWPAWIRGSLGVIGLVMVLATAVLYDTGVAFPGYSALLPTLGAAALIVSGSSDRRWSVYTLLRSGPMQYVGDLSYSLYLWHWPAVIFYREISGRELGLVDGLVVAVVSLALAHQSKVLIEDRFRAPGYLRSTAWRPFGFALVCISLPVLCWFSIGTQVQRHAQSMSDASQTSQLRPSLATVRKDVPKVYATKCHLGLVEHDPRACEVGGRTGGVKAFVIGDSHAAQWLPAFDSLERKLGWEINSYTKSACLFADVEVKGGRSGDAYSSCTEWNRALLGVIESESPQFLLVSQSNAYRVAGMEHGKANFARLVKGLVSRWQVLRARGIKIVVLADTPHLGIDVPECLSKPDATLDGCTRTFKQASSRPDPLIAAAKQAGVPVVNMSDLICPRKVCPPAIDNVLVWRDSHHITATFAEEHGADLAARVAAALKDH